MTGLRVVLIAGPNGSGKSTLTRQLPSSGIVLPERYINSDDIARAMQAAAPEVPQEQRNEDAFRQARQLRQAYREERVSFAFETVLSHPSTLIDMQKLRAAGYTVELVYVTTGDPEINVQRVAERVRTGGHHVEPDKVRSRYERALRLLPRAVEEADRASVFDSTDVIRLCYRKGRFNAPAEPPPYLQNRLLDPLTLREAERQRITAEFSGQGEIRLPDEADGTCSGPIRLVLSHYVVQETEPGAFLRHDRSALTVMPVQGTCCTIEYADGQGRLMP